MNDKRTIDEIDALAQEIRRVDGENSLGAGALAEALQPFLTELQHRREAEAVAWRWRYDDPAAPGKKLGWFFGPIEPPPNALGRSWSGWECEPLSAASPSSPASGGRVTEAMLDKALIAQHENDPAWKKRYDATAIRLRTEDMTRALIAALGEHP